MRVTTFTETMRGWIGPTAAPAGSEQESPGGELLLSDLHLRLPHPGSRDAGFAGGVLSGVVSAPGFTGRVNGGRAEILIREGGCRVMRYELLAESASGQRVHVSGMKYLRGGRLRLWSDTTTLFVEVRGLGAPGSVASGTARVLVRDLVPQVLSLRGSRAGFVCRFLRLALR